MLEFLAFPLDILAHSEGLKGRQLQSRYAANQQHYSDDEGLILGAEMVAIILAMLPTLLEALQLQGHAMEQQEGLVYIYPMSTQDI